MITGINHITFSVKNIEKSLRFYKDILGCVIVVTWTKGAYLQAGELWLCLSLDNDAQGETPKSYTHIAFNTTPENFKKLQQICTNRNIKVWKKNSSEGESLYILDPDFHKLEIHYSTLKARLASMHENPYDGQKLYLSL